MNKELMVQKLLNSYKYPNQKFCYYTGQNDISVAEALGIEQWDWTPQNSVNLEPFYWNTHTIPMTFGCKAVFTSEGKEWIEYLITNPNEVYDLEVPDIYSGRTGEILNLAKKTLDESSSDTLIRLPDIQSPLGVCELMWDQSFYVALLTNLDEIKLLLDKVTSFIIAYVNELKSVLGDRYNPACHPHLWSDTAGYYIADDANSMVAPEMHYNLSVEYINRITEKCGPLFYHTCTATHPYIENIKKVNNKKEFNWSVGTSMDPAKIIELFSGEVLLAPHIGKDIHREEGLVNLGQNFRNEIEVIEYFLNSMKKNTTMNIVLHDSILEDMELIRSIYKLFYSKGYTPQN